MLLSFPQELSNHFDYNESAHITLEPDDKPYALVRKFVSKQATVSFSITTNKSEEAKESQLLIGEGLHGFRWNETDLYALVARHGDPIFNGCSAQYFTTCTIFTPNSKGQQAAQLLRSFIDYLLELDNVRDDSSINVYSFHMKYEYWKRSATRPKRSLTSVYSDVRDRASADLESFLSKDSRAWYQKHGIPFKRNYMFHGPPGSGKTSMIQALASHFDRNICFIQPCNPLMTDDVFKSALQSTPKKSVIVLEDIDSLFAKNRSKHNSNCPLTFSGFLNGLDGLGSPNGQVIMMTTNHMERLDPALVRAGRVDALYEMSHASTQQVAEMFLSFYPNETKLAESFAATITHNKISMATCQNHFIVHRLNDAATCAHGVDLSSLRSYQEALNSQDEESTASAQTEGTRTASQGESGQEEKKASDDNEKEHEENDEKTQGSVSKSNSELSFNLVSGNLAQNIQAMLELIVKQQQHKENDLLNESDSDDY